MAQVGGRLARADALLLCELLSHHPRLVSLDLSHCRLTHDVCRSLVEAIGAALALAAPPALTHLRLAGNRLRPASALALLSHLQGGGATALRTLDLSSTELCGGSLVLPRTFGEPKAAGAKISDGGLSASLRPHACCTPHTVPSPLGALLTWRAMCGTGEPLD